MPPSTYREKKPDLDSSCNIIEFKSLGTKVKNVKKFYVVNPTASGYEFEWKKLDEDKLPPTANNANDKYCFNYANFQTNININRELLIKILFT